MKPYYLYVIESDNGRHYIGITENVERRLEAHNLGLSRWTKRYKNWTVIYREKLNNLSAAKKKENYLKSLKSGKQFYQIIGKNNYGP
jgi:putative endonuclease